MWQLSAMMRGLPNSSSLSRRAWLSVIYTPKGGSSGTDISNDLSQYLLSMSYTDNLHGKADDLSLTLEDRGMLWQGDWFPEQGSLLDVTIHTYNWENLMDGEKTLALGQFEIDEIEIAGMPSTVQIKAVSVPNDTKLRGVKRSRTWDEITVKKCANDIATGAEMELFYDCDEDPKLDHVEQSDESDLSILEKICSDAGFSLKVTPEKVIVFDEVKYEAADAVALIVRPGMMYMKSGDMPIIHQIEGYRFRAKTRDVYGSCHVKYQKGEEKELIEATFEPENPVTDKVLEVSEQVESVEEAERLAKRRLREANKETVTGSFTIPGRLDMTAGILVNLVGFEKMDGKYIITKAQHSLGQRYTVTVDVRRCLDGY